MRYRKIIAIFFTLDPLKFSLYDCEPVLQGEASFAKSPAQQIAAHKQFAQKETGCYYASLAKHFIKVVPLV